MLKTVDIKSLGRQQILLIACGLLACILLTVVFDFLSAYTNQYSFYISESLIFSSFWWLFLPLILLQFNLTHQVKSKFLFLILILCPLTIHLFAYPAMVWLLSTAFYNHQFAYWQTFQYEWNAFSFVLLIVYSVPVLLYFFIKGGKQQRKELVDFVQKQEAPLFLETILISSSNKKNRIQVADIICIKSQSPYIQFQTIQGKYLQQETLRSISEKINPGQFVRIHKSCIINIDKVINCRSRMNGDYDLTMTDGTLLRLSRNYVTDFRQKWENRPQVSIK